ncbi:uncharacterized protein CTHT_0067130 [Thermochaetoides thermophila DSM 1495]|uniref:Uncharacterized protein n=1 Tax=Chaetomium thermophilum (strain DSM 1495 / CBS 144.50 / IMI 039719) TaxID=759272 RepID=G0SGP9_CHATD|nr:hypothetical protein CTHT_0067130 [Thermochaetoides thermophila DSM 1495]EGS17388.1 hypothetical protein CTHT_0067130 [Thermochaetoides thermophila DSM 1495]
MEHACSDINWDLVKTGTFPGRRHPSDPPRLTRRHELIRGQHDPGIVCRTRSAPAPRSKAPTPNPTPTAATDPPAARWLPKIPAAAPLLTMPVPLSSNDGAPLPLPGQQQQQHNCPSLP